MKEQLVSFETAKLAKEKGFDYTTFAEYMYREDQLMIHTTSANFNLLERRYSAPTQSLLQKWLREKYTVDVDVSRNTEVNQEVYFYVKVSDFRNCEMLETPICTLWNIPHKHYGQIDFGQKYNYEEALEKGLQEALKLI